MNNIYRVSKEDLIQNIFKDYKADQNYDKKLDLNYILNINEGEIGTNKIVTVKQELLVCKKECNTCKKETEKIYNLINNNCGTTEERDVDINVKIPSDVQDGQVIILASQGRRDNNKYGNLNVRIRLGNHI